MYHIGSEKNSLCAVIFSKTKQILRDTQDSLYRAENKRSDIDVCKCCQLFQIKILKKLGGHEMMLTHT